MPIAQCKHAHRITDTPVIEGNNICAGGEEGTSMLIHCLVTKECNRYNFSDKLGKTNAQFTLFFGYRKR